MPKITENFNFILLNVGYSEFNADWNWQSIYSPFARIYYVTGGEAITYINDKPYKLKPNTLYLTPPFTLHNDECNNHFSLYYIHFYEDILNKESMFDKYNFPIEVKSSSLERMLVERLLAINPNRHLSHYDPQLYDNTPTFSRYITDNNKTPLHSKMETLGILYQLLSNFFSSAKEKSDNRDYRIINALKYIHENTDKDIATRHLSKMVCLTEDHFIRIFKKEMNYTPMKYVNMKKMERAQFLLLTTDMTMRDIALELSLDNISYFNRIFKYYTNKTPSQYRLSYSNL